MNILRLDDKRAAAGIIYQCFSNELDYLSRDKTKIVRAMESVLSDRFFAAYEGSELAGVLGYATSSGRAIDFDFNAFRQELGFFTAVIAKLDFVTDTSLARFAKIKSGEAVLLEYICTAPHLRGRGAASALIQHAISTLPYSTFIIECYNENPAAALYKRLGFKEIKRKRALVSPKKGYKTHLTLEYIKEGD